MNTKRYAISLTLFAALFLGILLHATQSYAQSEHHSGSFLCGELPHGKGLAPGEKGLVDRFNNAWRPGPWLTKRRRGGATAQSVSCGGFTVDFEDVIRGKRIGFDDRTPTTHPVLGATTLGAARRETICKVFEYLGSILVVKGSPDVIINESQTDGSGFLAAASPFFFPGSGDIAVGGTMFDHITTGIDPTPGAGSYDARIIFDFGPWMIGGVPHPINSDWNSDPGSQIDLFSVALHEVTHTLGFLSLIRPDGSSGIGGAYSIYDTRLRAPDGSLLLDLSIGVFAGTAADLTSNGITFEGNRCGDIDPVYSPPYFAPGSSLSHFDSYRSPVRYVMRFATGGGKDRELTLQEQRALCDIGYTLVNGSCSRCLPIGNDDTASTFSGVEVCADVLANDINHDGGPLSIASGSVRLASGRGSVVVRDDRICFIPDADFTGTAYITYHPSSASGTGNRTTLTVWVRRDRSGATGLDSGLIAHWSFDDSTANDVSGNGNHGTRYGDPEPAPGTCGAGIHFDGVDDYIVVPKSPSLASFKRMTVSYWIKFYHEDGDPAGNTIGNGSDDRPRVSGFYSYSGPTEISHFVGYVSNAAGIRLPYDATVPLDQQSYVFVTFVIADDSLKAYMNGCLVQTTSRNGFALARDWDWFIGWSGDNSGDSKFLEGFMDEIRLYDRALTDDEILDLYLQCGGTLRMEATPTPLKFGIVECPRTDSTMTVTVRNVSDALLVSTASLLSGREFELLDGGTADIDGGKERTFTIRFHPGSPGFYSDTLILGGDCTRRIMIPLHGGRDSCAEMTDRATDALITKSVSDSVRFIGDPVTYAITIANAGPNAGRVEASDIIPEGIAVKGYALSDPNATFDLATGRIDIPHLAVGASVRLDISGAIESDAPDTITNCAEIMTVEGGDINFANNRACVPVVVRRTIITRGLDLDTIPWCLDTTGTLVVRNGSDDTIEVTTLIAPAENAFMVIHQTLPRVLAPGDSMEIEVRFAPDAEGPFEDELKIVSRHWTTGIWDTASARLRGTGRSLLAEARVDSQRAFPGRWVEISVRLITPIDEARIHLLRITLRYDSTFMLSANRSWHDMIRGTLLEKWFPSVRVDQRGLLVVEVEAPSEEEYLRGIGDLLHPRFRLVMGEHLSGPIDVAVEALDRACATIRTSPGLAGIDSICGLNYRLIESTSLVTKLALHPNRPNPFSGSTEIRFATPIEGEVRLEVYNAVGRRVGVLIDRFLEAGEHAVEWRAGEHAAGVYQCRLQLGETVWTIRMLQVK